MSSAPKFSVGDVVLRGSDFYRVEAVNAIYQYSMTRVFNPEPWNAVHDVAESRLSRPRADELKDAENDYLRELANDLKVAAAKYAEAVKKFVPKNEPTDPTN